MHRSLETGQNSLQGQTIAVIEMVLKEFKLQEGVKIALVEVVSTSITALL